MSNFGLPPEQKLQDSYSDSVTDKHDGNDDREDMEAAVVDDDTFDNIIGAVEIIVSDDQFQQRMNE